MPIIASDVVAALAEPLAEKATLLETPALAWQVPRLEAAHARVLDAVTNAPVTTNPVLEALRSDAVLAERDFDFAHRYAHRAFTLARYGAPGDAGRVIDRAMGRLWPRGLEVTQLSFQQEANATHTFAAALEHAEVREALAVVTPHAPKVGEHLGLAVAAGRKLGEALRQIDVLLAGGQEGSALFEARKAGLAVLAYFRETVDQLWPAGAPEHAPLRARLVGTYERVLAALAAERAEAAKAELPAPG